jgi:hypothetical protein
MTLSKLESRRKGAISVSQLHREGVVEIGVVHAFAFVVTGHGVHLFHVDCIGARGRAEHHRRAAYV